MLRFSGPTWLTSDGLALLLSAASAAAPQKAVAIQDAYDGAYGECMYEHGNQVQGYIPPPPAQALNSTS
jgi:hypothetical protein